MTEAGALDREVERERMGLAYPFVSSRIGLPSLLRCLRQGGGLPVEIKIGIAVDFPFPQRL